MYRIIAIQWKFFIYTTTITFQDDIIFKIGSIKKILVAKKEKSKVNKGDATPP